MDQSWKLSCLDSVLCAPCIITGHVGGAGSGGGGGGATAVVVLMLVVVVQVVVHQGVHQ